MCGIHGINTKDRDVIEKMVKKTIHRGPDDSGKFFSREWSLGHNRLSIIDLSEAGHQPMVSVDGKHAIVYNGEIYNFIEIKRELESLGEKFTSQTDTEVILKAYKKWRADCLAKFNGMFAFAILDSETEELFIARDRLGIKPLYYSFIGGKFAFSSEAKALFAVGAVKDINWDMFNIYMRMLYIPAPFTIWKNIFKLEPGHYIKVRNGILEKNKYWSLETKPLLYDKEQIKNDIKFIVEDSVKRQLVSDRSVGVFLSGGIDSTIIAGVASKYTGKLNTFSAGYEDTEEGEKYNKDRILAKKTAERIGANHHEYFFSAKNIIDSIPRSIYHMDEPISNHIQAVTMLLSEKTSPIATVVLGGDGGDELFGGYERHYYANLFRYFKFLCPVFGRKLSLTLGKEEKWRKICAPETQRYLSYFAVKENIVSKIIAPEVNNRQILNNTFEELYFTDLDSIDFARKMMRVDIASWLPNESLARSDKMTMAAGVEERVPFLDHRLVELADRIPIEYKIGKKGLGAFRVGYGYKGKLILKEAMKEYLSEEVLNADKWGWFSPASKWIRGPLLPLMKEVLSPGYNAGTAHLFNYSSLNKILDDHISKTNYALNTLWSVMTFQIWYRQFMSD